MSNLEQVLTAVLGAIGGAGTFWGALLLKRGKKDAPPRQSGLTHRILESLQEHTHLLREIHIVLIETRGQLRVLDNALTHLDQKVNRLHERYDNVSNKR
jgi:hypothetical protein